MTQSSHNLSGFVLAGGLSRRMGQDKARLVSHGRTLLDHMAALLSTVCEPVRVVGRGDLPDKVPGHGPLGGIATALEVSQTERLLVVAVDLPLLPPAFFKFLAERTLASPRPITVCRVGANYPLAFGLDRSLKPLADARIDTNRLSIHGFIDAANPEIVPEEELLRSGFVPEMFSNLNTPEDWRRISEASNEL